MADTLKLVKKISRLADGKRSLRFMEVCGTHTVANRLRAAENIATFGDMINSLKGK